MTDFTKLADEWSALAEKATPGPWLRIDKADYAEIHAAFRPSSQAVALVGKPDDADLIAKAGTDAPTIAQALRRAARMEEENARLQDKVDAITNGETFLYLRDEDRDKAALELDDASLAKWARWALTSCARFYADDTEDKERSFMEVITQSSVITLALLTLKANATKATFDVDGVSYKGEDKGDWRVTIEQKSRAALGDKAP